MHLPGLRIVGQVFLKSLFHHALADLGIERWKGDLDAAEEVTVHPVGAGEIHGAAALEIIDTMMLEEAADDRAHADVLGQPWDPGAQRANPTNDQVDLDAGLRRLVELTDD